MTSRNVSVRLDFADGRYIQVVITAEAAAEISHRVGTAESAVILMQDEHTAARIRFNVSDVLIMSTVVAPGGTFNHQHPVYTG